MATYLIIIVMKLSNTSIFCRKQELIGYLYYQFTYLTFYFVGLHTLYAIFTLNYYVLLFYAFIIVLQKNTKRSQKYIDWVNNVVQFRKGLHSTQLILEEEISP